MITFLYPNMLWGLLAVLFPVIIHLYHSMNSIKVNFSSIFYLNELKNNSIKKLNNVNWFLILLRMLIIICLVFMFSAPIIKNDSLWVPSEKEAVAVIVIDNSASMSLKIDNESLLDKSLNKISKIISSYSGAVEIKIFQTNPQKMIMSKFSKNFKMSDLNNIKIQQSFGQDSIWSFTSSVLRSIKNETANKECFILSDFSSPPDTSFEKNLDDWQFYFFGHKELKDNISIKNVSSKNEIKLQNENIDFLIKVENMGNKKIKNIPIEITLNNKRMGQIAASFEKNEVKDFLFRLLPSDYGILNGKVNIGSDSFLFDNNQTFEISIPNKIICKIISNSRKESRAYERVLNSINGNNSFVEYDIIALQRFNRINLNNVDVLIVADAANFTPRAVESIKKYLKSGGSIIWFSGDNYKSLKKLTQSNLSLPRFNEKIELEKESFLNVEIFERENEIFQNLNMRDLDEHFPKIFKYNNINESLNDNTILTIGNNTPFLLRLDPTNGSIYFFTSPLDLLWNDFQLKGILIPIFYRMIAVSSNDESNISPVIINQNKIVKIKNQDLNNNWILKTPSNNKILLVPDYKKEVLIIDQTNELGSYDILSNDFLFTSFSTKLATSEYPNNRTSEKKINQYISNLNFKWIDENSNLEESISSNRHGISLWKFFLLIAIVLYLIESFFSRPRNNFFKN